MQSDNTDILEDVSQHTGKKVVPKIISGFWRRLFAFIIDSIILGLIGFISGIFLFDFFMKLGAYGRLLGFVIALFYFSILNSAICKGQTLGKRAMKIKVVDKNGNYFPLSKCILCYSIFLLPWFLNGILLPQKVIMSYLGYIISIIIFGVGGSIIYLYMFNRKSRQSLHDLVIGKYVVRTFASGNIEVANIWKGHLIVVIICLLFSTIYVSVIVPNLAKKQFFSELLTLQGNIQNLEEVLVAGVVVGKSWNTKGELKYVSIVAKLKQKPKDYDKETQKIASLVFKYYPKIRNKDQLFIQLTYGYDIGIASAWVKQGFNGTPNEWEIKLKNITNH